jgi:hypothetical protein
MRTPTTFGTNCQDARHLFWVDSVVLLHIGDLVLLLQIFEEQLQIHLLKYIGRMKTISCLFQNRYNKVWRWYEYQGKELQKEFIGLIQSMLVLPGILKNVNFLLQRMLIIVYVDDIKALHSTADARHYREQFQLSSSYEPRWLTIIYTSGPKLKALHLVFSTVETHELWYKTLKKLRQHRKEVTGGLAFLMSPERKLNPEKSVRVIRRHWIHGIGEETAEVGFLEVERLCWKLNVHLSSKYLREKFDVSPLVMNSY